MLVGKFIMAHDHDLIDDGPKYIDINKEFLLSGGMKITFDVYAHATARKKDPPVLLFSKEAVADDISNVLKTKKYGGLCILQEDYHKFLDSAGEALEKTIENRHIPLKQKSSLVYNCATDTMKAVFADPRSGENLKRTQKITDTIIKFALGNQQAIPALLQLGSHNYYTFTHCVNVAVFSIGLWLTINSGANDDLKDFALGCILHDVGKSQIDDSILSKPGKLTDEEFALIKEHPRFGYELMEDTVSDIALDVILHHHERYNGTGYPDGLQETDISIYAKIAIIADVYDALTTNRAYGDALRPFDAAFLMKEEMAGYFEQDKLAEFIQFLGGNIH